ncbi:MAG: hypothetical protein DRQ10_02110 [Candidatus Hydrothermota bacterium]|nr:MAG: hypothetical protein DRQ10_02110 [Candidatus Hydrothermae bacterium]
MLTLRHIGKRNYKKKGVEMKVKEVMFKEVITVERYVTLRDLLMKFKGFHTFPVVPVVDNGKLIGIVRLQNLIDVFLPYNPEILKMAAFFDEFWEEDIFAAELAPEMGMLVLVEDIMDHEFIAVNENESIEKAYNLMRLHKKDQLPVVDDDGNLVGMVGVFDIIWAVFHQKGIV